MDNWQKAMLRHTEQQTKSLGDIHNVLRELVEQQVTFTSEMGEWADAWLKRDRMYRQEAGVPEDDGVEDGPEEKAEDEEMEEIEKEKDDGEPEVEETGVVERDGADREEEEKQEEKQDEGEEMEQD